MMFETYRDVVLEQYETSAAMTRIGSKAHQLYTLEYEKKALGPIDDKRVCFDGIATFAHGYNQPKTAT